MRAGKKLFEKRRYCQPVWFWWSIIAEIPLLIIKGEVGLGLVESLKFIKKTADFSNKKEVLDEIELFLKKVGTTYCCPY